MLKKKKRTKIDPNSTDTLLGEGTIFEGNIKSEASICIEGSITGDIECKGDVTINENGNANSSITTQCDHRRKSAGQCHRHRKAYNYIIRSTAWQHNCQNLNY